MTFLHTSLAIAGVSAIAIPILIHLLFRQRRRVVKWGAMKFLMEAYRKARKRMRLEQWLLLATRCLLVAIVGAALARPLISGSVIPVGPSGRLVYLVIDNGLVSSVQHPNGATALEEHRAEAQTIIESLGSADRVSVVALAGQTTAIIDPPTTDHGAALRAIQSLSSDERSTNIEAGLNKVAESIGSLEDDPRDVFVYLLSDFLRGSADLRGKVGSALAFEDRKIHLLASQPMAQGIGQVQITGVQSWRGLVIPGQADLGGQFTVQLRRVGDVSQPGTTTVRLSSTGEDSSEAQTQVVWQAGQSVAEAEMRLDTTAGGRGEIVIKAEISPDALAGDNVRRTVVEVREEVRVAVVDREEFGTGRVDEYSAGSWVRRALAPGEASPMAIVNIDGAALDRGSLRGVAAALITRPDLISASGWEAVGEFARSGGLLWIMPPSNGGVAVWGDRAASALDLDWRWARETVEEEANSAGLAIDGDAPARGYTALLQGEFAQLADAVRVWKRLPIDEGIEEDDVIVRLGDGSAWLTAQTTGRGRVVYLASSPHLDWTSLPAKPLMIALLHEVVRQGLGAGLDARTAIAGDSVDARLPGAAVRLEGLQNAEEGIDRTSNVFASSGVYVGVDERGGRAGTVVVNVNPDAARTEPGGAAAVSQWLSGGGDWEWIDDADPASALAGASNLGEIGFWLLCLAGALVLIEAWLARRFSHAQRGMYDEDGRRWARRGSTTRIVLSSFAAGGGRGSEIGEATP